MVKRHHWFSPHTLSWLTHFWFLVWLNWPSLNNKYKAGINLPYAHHLHGSSHLKESIKPSVFLHYHSCKWRGGDYGKGRGKKKCRALCKTFAKELDIKDSILKFVLCQGECLMATGSSEHFKIKGKHRKEN